MRLLLIVGALLLGLTLPAKAAFQFADIACETTATTGTGTINLAGAVTNYLTFSSQITSGNTVPYQITSGDGKRETGIGTYTDASPDTMTRTASWSTDGSGAELTLSGTSTVCIGPIASVFIPVNGSGRAMLNTTSDSQTDQFGTRTSQLSVANNGSVTDFAFSIRGYNNAGAYFTNTATKHATDPAGHNGAFATDSTVGAWENYVSDGTDTFVLGSALQTRIDGSSSDNVVPTRMALYTTATNSITQRMAWKSDGGVIVGDGSTSPGSEKLSVEGGAIELGNAGASATDTTIARSAAGLVSIEGVVIPTGSPDVQTMTSTGSGDSWDKPTGGQRMCYVELWGGGGSGGKGAAAAAAGGGGGGAYKAKLFRMADLSGTEQVTIATGGTSQSSASTDGNPGGNTTFGASATLVTAYGGGGGDLGATGGGGGGGGGARAAGGAGATITGGTTDGLAGTVGNLNTGPYGTPGGNGIATGNAVTPIFSFMGGAGGGGSTGDATGTNAPGGASEFGGGGGGAAAEDSAPGPGAGGASSYGGAGGAGAFDANNGTPGSQPGGGGGGAETGNSGAGGNGQARITCW